MSKSIVSLDRLSFTTGIRLLLSAPLGPRFVMFLLLPLWTVVPLREGSSGFYFGFSTFTLLPMLASAVFSFERSAARRLAFIKALPLGHETKWLTLVPACALVLLLTTVSAAVRRLSLPVALTMLGCGWWAVAIGHRFARRRSVQLWLAMPLSCLGAGAAKLALAAGGGWWLAAAVSLTLALVDMTTTRDQIGELLAAGTSVARGAQPMALPAEYFGRPPRPRQPNLLQTVSELWLLSTSRIEGLLLFGLMVPSGLLSGVLDPAPAVSALWFIMIPPLIPPIVKAHSPDAHEFLRTRPFRPGWLVAGTVVPWALIALLPLAVAFLNLKLGTLRGGLEGTPLVGTRVGLRYLREIVGATWLPNSAAAGPLPLAIWIPLRQLLYWHVLRLALLTLALLFSISGFSIAASQRKTAMGRWPRLLLVLVTVAANATCTQMMVARWRGPLRAPPLWLCAALALAGIASMFPPRMRLRR